MHLAEKGGGEEVLAGTRKQLQGLGFNRMANDLLAGISSTYI
jgi:hypothetical protein